LAHRSTPIKKIERHCGDRFGKNFWMPSDRDIADALWAADAVEKLLCKLCRQAAGELEAIAQALRRWAR
jgi:hypothetical protein